MSLPFWNSLFFLQRQFPEFVSEEKTPSDAPVSGRLLAWDSEFFNANIYKIDSLTDTADLVAWEEKEVEKKGPWQIFAEVPSEAVSVFELLSRSGFRLVETRFTYFHLLGDLPTTEQSARFATEADIEALKRAASGAINDFDKYHADPFYSSAKADAYLETYIANCVRGFAEKVLVPDLETPPASFVALSRIQVPGLKAEAGPFFRIPLTACLPENRGWHFPLCLAALHYAKAEGGKALVMTTQSTNKAVIHNCEKLGFRFGSCTHLFAKSHIS